MTIGRIGFTQNTYSRTNSAQNRQKKHAAFGAFHIKELQRALENAAREGKGVGIAPDEGVTGGVINFIVYEAKGGSDAYLKAQESRSVLKGFWAASDPKKTKPRELNTVYLDQNGYCNSHNIIRPVHPDELPLPQIDVDMDIY